MNMRDNSGITLIELMVVVSIIGILVVALGFSYQGWMGKYRVESQIREIYVDILNSRARAMQRNRIHFVDFPDTTSYAIYEDDANGTAKTPDGNGTLQSGGGANDDTRLPTYPKTLRYAVKIGTVAGVPPITFSLNTRGLINPLRSICIFTDFDGDSEKKSDYDPDYDCVVLSETKVETGKLTKQNTDGGLCESANCVTT